jgi:hypothetical protein
MTMFWEMIFLGFVAKNAGNKKQEQQVLYIKLKSFCTAINQMKNDLWKGTKYLKSPI